MDVTISRAALAQIISAAAASPHEVCGLMRGQGDRVTTAEPCRNVADDPATRFEIDPAALFTAMRNARRGGLPILGHYHSHPRGPAFPSVCDAAAASDDGQLWLIVACGDAALFRAVAGGAIHDRFEQVSFTLE